MKKIALLLLSTACCFAVEQTKQTKRTQKAQKSDYGVAIMLKNGYFYPQEERLRNVFDRKGSKGGYWFEGALRYDMYKGLNVEASGSYFKKDGYASNCTDKIEITMPTFGLGLKYFWSATETLYPFLGAGMRVFFYDEKNCSQYVQSYDKTVVGGMVNAGLEWRPYKGLLLDLFVDYNGAKLDKNNYCSTTDNATLPSCCPSCWYDITLGGVVAGIGIGFQF